MNASQTPAAAHLLADHAMPGLLYASLDPVRVHATQFPECHALDEAPRGDFDCCCATTPAAPAVHVFASSADAYDASQCDEAIRDGDILSVPSESTAAVLAGAWPVAVTLKAGEFHTLTDGATFATFEGGKYAASAAAAVALLASPALFISAVTQVIHTSAGCSVTRRNHALNLALGVGPGSTPAALAARAYVGCKRCGAHEILAAAQAEAFAGLEELGVLYDSFRSQFRALVQEAQCELALINTGAERQVISRDALRGQLLLLAADVLGLTIDQPSQNRSL
jgi:hypothetical protein